MNLCWLTDIHLEFLNDAPRKRFLAKLSREPADCFAVSGDIAVAPMIVDVLREFAESVNRPIYFVLGNHDYYNGSITKVREAVRRLVASDQRLRWLSDSNLVMLTETTALIGHDGWGDARLGSPRTTPVMLNDFIHIRELAGLDRADLVTRLNRLGDEAAAHFAGMLPKVIASASHIVVLTHVPPFAQAAWHQGQPSGPDWLPFFSCKAVGDVLLSAMRDNPDRKMTVLCGHTHGSGTAQILPNLKVITGGAQYGKPKVQKTLNVGLMPKV